MLPWAHPSPHAKLHLGQFSHFCTPHCREFLCFTMGRPFCPQIAPLHGASGPPCYTWFLGPTQVHRPNGISISSVIVAWLTTVTDRQTDRPRYSICNNRPHLNGTVMQPYKTISEFLYAVMHNMYLLEISFLWPPYVIGQAIVLLSCGFFFFYLSNFFFPHLFSAVADWMSTILPHIVWP